MIRVLRAILTILGIAAAQSVPAATYIVTNVLDSGPGSLREAILNANANGGPDEIQFAIGSGLQTIQLTQILPDVTDPVVIDGSTQPGYVWAPLIVLNGTLAPQGQHGLRITAGNSTIRALVVNGFPAQFLLGGGHGIVLQGGGTNTIVGCYIGTNAQGTAAVSNAGDGIRIESSSNNRIGVAAPAVPTGFSNLISGNSNGVTIHGVSNGNSINGNFIGTTNAGLSAIPNSITGISVFAGMNNCVGCGIPVPGFTVRNLISGNDGDGVFVGAPQTLVATNLIGWNAPKLGVVPNDGDGVEVNAATGGQIVQNEIAGNTFNGIILTSGATGVTVEQNIVGSQGVAGAGNTLNGILVTGANGNLVKNNVAGGNGTRGIRLRSGAATNTVVGNIVGLDATGVLPIPNAESGIEINDGATNNVVGGAAAVDANVVGYNSANGILITDATTTGNTLLGNFIGSRSDLGPAPNTMHGIAVTNGSSGNFVGGTAPGDGNRIHFNTGAGVFIESGTANMVRGNGISLNGGLGIDLAPLGVNPNDPGDGDGGPNNGANYPVINSVLGANGQTTITGMIDVPPGDVHPFIHFYAGGDCDPSGNGEGAVYLGTTSVHALTGTVPFNVTLPVVAPGKSITASLDYLNSSSEFSPCIFTPLPVVSQLVPDNGPAAGGTPVAITGQTFQTGASVQFANEFATNVVVGGPTSITAETPVLSPGVLNTVGVINPDGQAGTFFNAFLSDFIDVPQAHPFHDFVEAIFRAGVTAGCGFGYFCVDQAVPRDQMAVFLLIAKNGSSYVPPPATGTVFLDVPASAFGAAFIEALSAAGVTAGCGGNNYCPADPVTRAQMSVMILRTLEGSMYFPPPATGTVFTDVPLGSFADAWIEEMSDRGITSGCGPGIFCPDLSTTRGQMAVFLAVAFML